MHNVRGYAMQGVCGEIKLRERDVAIESVLDKSSEVTWVGDVARFRYIFIYQKYW